MHCKHTHTYYEAEEESRIYGTNYDIVTIMLHQYCDRCGEHVGHSEMTRKEAPMRSVRSGTL